MLKGKRAVVTGGAGGFGSEIAYTLANAGADIALIDIDESGMANTAIRVKELGRDCICIEADLADASSIKKATSALFSYQSYCDILVNNAAVCIRGPLLDFSIDDWDKVMNTNLRAIFLVSRLLAGPMIANKSGKIINISSNASFYGTPESGPYAVSKAGINQLTKTMAVEWGEYNIQVNCICPGIAMTAMARNIWDDPSKVELRERILNKIPLGRFAELSDIMPTILLLASSGSDYINGAMIPIDSGAKFNPG